MARSRSSTEFLGINVVRQHTAESIDLARKSVAIKNAAGEKSVRYDRLIIATGATPTRPNLPGSAAEGVLLLHTMDDSFVVHRFLTERQPERQCSLAQAILGLRWQMLSGSEGLTSPRLAVGRRCYQRLIQHSALWSGRNWKGTACAFSAGKRHPADLVLFAVGVRPNSDLAHRAGAKLGTSGAIVVTRRMQTNLPEVFAAGDCVETYHRLLDRPTYISLGTIAHKQGRVAGENAVGGDRQFAGAIGTQSLKVFNLAIARTGLLNHEARSGGFDPLTVATVANDHKAYYPGAVPLHILMSFR